MIGAAVGLDNIPEAMREKVLSFDCTNGQARKKRPDALNMKKHLMANIEKLLEIRPKAEEVVIHLHMN